MKKIISLFVLLGIISAACTVQVAITNPTTSPATPTPVVTLPATSVPTRTPLSPETKTTYAPLSLTIPASIADGASGKDVPAVTASDAAWWQKTPGHLLVMLGDYYVLKGKAHAPQIYVFPAQAYAELVPTAFESIRRVNNILSGSVSPTADQLPALPFSNDRPAFASNIKVVSFQNGSGVRFLTQTGQYAAPANNQDVFYAFHGLTRDGAYYIVATFPVTNPMLAETRAADAPIPSGGIPYPYLTNPAGMPAYYTAITALLDAQPSEKFTPALAQLDALIQSMLVKP